MAQGVGFSIDASFLNKIEQADKALKKLADTNDTVVKNISNTWKQIGEQGLDSYLRSLEKQKNVLADIASIKFDDSAPYYLKKFGENAKSSVAEIDKLIQTLTTLQQATPKQQAIEKARQEAYDIVARADAKTGGKDWSLTGEVALREYQAQLEAMRRYVAERKAMYAQMFDEIDAKERKQQADYSNYRQQQLNDELTQYRKNKDAQLAIDKRNYEERRKQLQETFDAETKVLNQTANVAKSLSTSVVELFEKLNKAKESMSSDNLTKGNKDYWNHITKLMFDHYAKQRQAEQDMANIRRRNIEEYAAIYAKLLTERDSVALKNFFANSTSAQAASEKAMMQIQSTEQNRQIKQNIEDVTRAFQERAKVWEEGFRRVEEQERKLAINAAKTSQDFAKQLVDIFDQINKAQASWTSDNLLKNNKDYWDYTTHRMHESFNRQRSAEQDMANIRRRNLEEYAKLYSELLVKRDKNALQNFFDNSVNLQAMSERAMTQIQSGVQNRQVRQNADDAAKAFSDRMKAWEEGFRRAEQRERELATNAVSAAKEFGKSMLNIFDQINKAQIAFESKRRQDILNRMQRTGDTSGQATAAYNRLFSGKGNMSLNNMQTALAKLQDAQRKLNLDTDAGKQKYEQLAAMIKRVQQRINEATGASDQLQKKHNSLINTGDQLMRKFALVFSVSQIQGYINKLVQVRGEFELQQRALQSILQNKDEANKIWQQTVDLAVRSPFRVGELVKYTKQLAAYRIETDRLHDTTKRLADVSAGLGVDMSRLILAFGQVRAAEYLRGTELRQFTEAGIPMLEELSRHFTELEGRVVSTADVFGMISKRMVAFEDVEAVFKRMTDAGGVFYNMQEIQAETLKGQISNLHDSIDLMLNDIGKANEGTLKGGIQVAKYFVDNWESVVFVIKDVIAALIGLKLHQLATKNATIQTALSMGVVTNASTKQLTALQLLQVGWSKLTGAVAGAGATMKSVVAFNLPLLAITAIIGGIVELISTFKQHQDQIKEINKEYDDLLSKSNRVSVNFRYATVGGDFDKQKAELMQLVNIANNDYNMNIHVDLEGLSKEDIEEKFGEIRNQILQFNAFQREFDLKLQQAREWTAQDDVTEDLQQYGSAATALMNHFYNNTADLVHNLQEKFDKLSESEKEALAILEEPIKTDETELQYLERVRKAYDLLTKDYQKYKQEYDLKRFTNEHREVVGVLKEQDRYLKGLGINAKNLVELMFDYDNKIKEAEREFNNLISTIDINERLPKDKKELYIKTKIDKQGWNDFTTEIAYRLANQKWNLEIGVVEKPKEEDWEKWQKEYNDYIKTLSGKLREASPNSERFALAQQLSEQWQEYNKIIKAFKAGAKEITKKEFASAEQMAKSYNLAYKWLTGEDIKEKGKKDREGKDWWLEMVKGIQSLHKEFLTLNKDLDDTAAKTLAIDKHKTLFEEIKSHLGASASAINIDEIDFTDENAFKDFLRGLKEIKGLSAEARLAIEKALTNIEGEATINIAIEETDSIKRAISDMFGSYELSLELEKLNIPPDLAKQLFGVESLDLSSLRNKILDKAGLSSLKGKSNEEIYDSGAFKKLSEERQKAVKDGLEKEEELERKAQEERLKKYVKYLQKAQDARVKIKLDELRQIDEVEKESRFSKDQKKEIKEALQKESKQALDKQTWEDFTGSAFYIEIFKDMENTSTKTLEIMRDRLMNMRDSLKNLNPEDLKAIVEQIEKIDDKLRSRQAPEWEIGNNFKGMVDYLKNRSQWETELAKYQAQSEDKNKEINDLAKEIAEWQRIMETAPLDSEQYINAAGALHDAQKRMAKLKEESKGIDTNITKFVDKLTDGKFSLDDFSNGIKAISAAFQGAVSMINNLNIGMSEGFQDTLDFATEAATSIDQMVDGFTAIATNPKSLSGYIQVLGGVSSLVGAIFSAKDKRLERQIEKQIKLVEDLEYAYQRLEKRIEDAYSVGSTQSFYELAKNNLKQQLAATQQMIALEEQKKKTDQDKIRQWKQEIKDMQEQLEELDAQRIEALGGFGSETNYKSAAEEFANAWFDAYKEVGDGISGLEDTFDEFINNVVKKQLLIRGSEQLLKPMLKMIDEAVNDGIVTTREMAEIHEKWNGDTKDALNSYYKGIADMYSGMISGTGELSDLARGVQNITEPQAAAIEAYLNSIRFFVSDSNNVLKQIQQSFNINTSSPMISELKAQTELIRTIDSNLSSVIGRGNPAHTGAYIKVLAK